MRKHPASKPYDVTVIGGGPAGLTMALLLGQAGLRVSCLEAMPQDVLLRAKRDGRTTALSLASKTLLHHAGIWDSLADQACPIQDIVILDENTPVQLDFDAAQVADQPFGWIIDNTALLHGLHQQVQLEKRVDIRYGVRAVDVKQEDDQARVELDNGDHITARLMVAADGRQSAMRGLLSIPVLEHDYAQTALVGVIYHEKPHQHVAIEHFRTTGPFAVLPMCDDAQGRHRSTLIWTVETQEATQWQAAQPAVLNQAVSTRMMGRFGAVEGVEMIGAWPLSCNYAVKTTAPRAVVIADAAHGMHPIAGQGLNMSLRDVASLAKIIPAAHHLGKDIGGYQVLRQFVKDRRLDNAAMMAATHGLNGLFGMSFGPVEVLRSIGLTAVSNLPPLKKFFMRQAMGMNSGIMNDLMPAAAVKTAK